ncbi:MAG TPA: YIP1 family protein, partial [Anaerolineales bacterium]|nr:YIP1 family protein [Anaerolineales bacterium]
AFPVWSKVFTRPGEQTFLEITDHPEAKATSAYIWVFIVGTLSGLINSLVRFIVTMIGFQQAMPDFGQTPGLPGAFGAAGLLGAICGAPITGFFSVIGFALSVAIIHATARFFGGQGSFDKLAYGFGAIAVPFSVISGLLAPFSIIPYVAFCTVPVLLALGLYVLFLETAAIKAVHRFTWGEAAATLLLPTILLGLLCGIAFLALMRVAAPYINEIFQGLQQVQ